MKGRRKIKDVSLDFDVKYAKDVGEVNMHRTISNLLDLKVDEQHNNIERLNFFD